MIALTEKILTDAGGWQAMKHARALAEIGRVSEVKYAPPLLTGTVREGDASYRAGLKISTATDIENLCTCRESREWGKICAHSLAVGVALLRPRLTMEAMPPAKPAVEAVRGPFFTGDGAGDAVLLHIVLAPNFQAAWEKNQIMAGIEAVCGGRRVLLHALDAKKQFRCDEYDLRVIEKIRSLNGGAVAGMLLLPRERFLELLDALRGHPRVHFGKATPVSVCLAPLKPILTVKTNPQFQTTLRVGLPSDGRLLIAGTLAWLVRDSEFQEVAPGLPAAYHSLLQCEIQLTAEEAAKFFAIELPALQKFFEVRSEGEAPASATIEPARPDFSLMLEGSLNHLSARLQATYGVRVLTVGITPDSENFLFADPASPAQLLTRNVAAEEAALARLTRRGFTAPDATGLFKLSGERQILAFFAREFQELQREWKVSLGSRFSNVTREIERVRPRIDVQSSGEDWFELQISLGAPGGERFSSADIQQLLQHGQSSVRLKNGRLAVFDAQLLDELNDVLRDCDPQQTQAGHYRINKAHAGYLDAVAGDGADFTGAAAWRDWARMQTRQEKVEPTPLGALEDILRNYQKEGVYWINFLAVNGFGGILADEMGLGKTLQALAHLSQVAQAGTGPSLVVCPSTLVQNWMREAARFAPNLKTIAIEGTARAAAFERLGDADLAITSYALLRRDIDRYRGVQFATIVLDEAQHIKNPDTQNAQAATLLKGRMRLVLTGTPMENSVRDLWSMMNFLMPGYLGSRDDFRDRFELPISKGGAKLVQGRLAKRLRPFMLRRLKRDVLKELPDKIEQVSYCELNAEQREVYSKLLQLGRSQIEATSTEPDKSRSHLIMLTALLRLRQACCDLRLLKLDGVPEAVSSSKCDLLDELLQEAIDGGHRVLVFSQFASMLRILKARLERSGIAFCHMDGQSRDRAESVDRFQNSPDIPVFLISLKAGGVGLNLTAADTVIHFDPWWNPAIEAQATDRAHRIGQNRVVTSYKLIARDTIEEKILSLQRKKREWIDATIESDEPMMTGLTTDEIRALFD